MMTTEQVRDALLEAFEIDARLPKVKGPARLKAQNIGGMVEDPDELKASIAHAIAEATRGLTMGDEETTNDNIAALLRGKAPLPRGETKWTGAVVARFLAEAMSNRVDPTNEEIAVMEERMAWLRLISVPDARALSGAMTAEVSGRSRRWAAKRVGMSDVGLTKLVLRACGAIASALSANSPAKVVA